jgi:hypothetical protein
MEEAKPVRKTSQLAWVLVFLGAVVTVVEILSVSCLGTNANHTFRHVGEDSPGLKQPAPAAPRPPVADANLPNP